jgi:hypothetical protein
MNEERMINDDEKKELKNLVLLKELIDSKPNDAEIKSRMASAKSIDELMKVA